MGSNRKTTTDSNPDIPVLSEMVAPPTESKTDKPAPAPRTRRKASPHPLDPPAPTAPALPPDLEQRIVDKLRPRLEALGRDLARELARELTAEISRAQNNGNKDKR